MAPLQSNNCAPVLNIELSKHTSIVSAYCAYAGLLKHIILFITVCSNLWASALIYDAKYSPETSIAAWKGVVPQTFTLQFEKGGAEKIL